MIDRWAESNAVHLFAHPPRPADMRSNLDQLYVQKTREVVNGIRHPYSGPAVSSAFVESLKSAVGDYGATRTVDSAQ
jgi:hypothetical protein